MECRLSPVAHGSEEDFALGEGFFSERKTLKFINKPFGGGFSDIIVQNSSCQKLLFKIF
jgi:hypothetical protein